MKKNISIFISFILFTALLPLSAHAWPIPDSGQTKCYDDAGNELNPCPYPGEDFYGQDGNYLINPWSYTKLDPDGNDLPDNAASWAMVRDNVTGLIWEVKTDDGSVHDKDNTYTWYDSNPETNGGDAGKPGDGTDTEDFISQLNTAGFGGYSDWRLPTLEELSSIINLNLGRYNIAINISFFPNNNYIDYWSSTTYANNKGNAWCVRFGDGGIRPTYKSFKYSVCAVRSGQTPLDNLVINNDGTVTDTQTGLMWQQATAGNMTWGNALSYCETLSFAGYSDWRLPSREELRSLIDYEKYAPSIAKEIFSDTISSDYWSSTTYASGTSSAWGVNFNNGGDGGGNKLLTRYVRAVRNRQSQISGHLHIISPSQASFWNIGDTMPIRWEPQDISGNVKITLSRDGGTSFNEIIANNTSNDGDYDWTVCGTASVNCALKIEPLNDTSESTVQSPFLITLWTADINVNGEKINGQGASYEEWIKDHNSLVNQCSISIGVGSEQITIPSPPTPPEYSVFIRSYPVDWSDSLWTYLQLQGEIQYIWTIAINPSGNALPLSERTSTLSWNPEEFGLGSYELRKGYDGNGEIVVADMKTITSYDVTGGNSDQLFNIIYTPSATPENIPPSAPTLKSANPAPNIWTTDPTVEISWNPGQDSESGVAGYSYNFNNSVSFDPDTTVDTTGTQLELPPLPPVSSEYYFHIRTVDNSGNVSDTLHVGPFKIDNLPPTGSISINSNASSTSSQNVFLSISAADSGSGLSQMKFSNDNISWSSPVSYATSAAWTLTSGQGDKTVYARFSDTLGNWTGGDITDTITLETTIRPEPPAGLTATSGSRSATLQWNEVSAETAFHIYRSDSENGFYVKLTSDPHYNPYYIGGKWKQIFNDENLINGLEYWYKVTALRNGLESNPASPVKALPAALTGGDFRLELMETSGMVAANNSIVFHILVTGEDRFAEEVNLSATGILPSGIIKTFSGNPVKPTGMASLRLDIPYSASSGDYTVKIIGISTDSSRSHDTECNLKIVNMAGGQSRITAQPQKESYRLGENAEIYGQLLPWQASGTAMSVLLRKSGDAQWTSYPAVIGENSAFRFSYLPQHTGEYEIKAAWKGNAYVAACESEISAFAVTRGRSEIRVTTVTPAPEPGDTVSLSIELSPPYEGQPLYFEILKPGLNVPQTVEGLFTQSQGKRSFIYTLEENLPGIWKFKAAWAGNEEYTGSVSLPLVLYPGIEVGQALILAGGGMDQNTLWETTEFLANRFYQILQKRRFDHDQIYYISDFTHDYDLNGDGENDILVDEHSPSVGIVRNYLESLYRPGQAPLVGANRPLILYLADHGGMGQFKINAGEYLKAEDLDTWLDALQTATGCRIVLIAEACHSGTFIEKLAATGDQQRILISSSNTEVSNYDQDGVQSFSRFFFDQVAQGDSLRNCFFKARKEMGNHHLFKKQDPQIRNELAAADFYIGGTFVVGDILPEIVSLTPSQIISAGKMELFAEGADAEGLDSAWVSIIPPGFETAESTSDFQTPLYNFDRVELSDPEKDRRFAGTHDFPYNGDYILTFFVQDTGGNVASQEIRLTVENGTDPPVPGNVNGDQTVNLADAILALKIACGADIGSATVTLNADVNNDRRIGPAEAVYILRKVAGL